MVDYLVVKTLPSSIAVPTSEVASVGRPEDTRATVIIELSRVLGGASSKLSDAVLPRTDPESLEQRLLLVNPGPASVGIVVPNTMFVKRFADEDYLPLPHLLTARCCFAGMLLENGAPCALVIDCAELIRDAAAQSDASDPPVPVD